MHLYRARHVLPVATAPIRDGAIVVDAGRVRAVGPADRLTEQYPRSRRRDLGEVALLPGLINAHTHLELSALSIRDLPGGEPTRWVRGLLAARRGADAVARASAIDRAIDELEQRGVVAVGDVSNTLEAARPLARSSLEGVVFHELLSPDPEACDRVLADADARESALAGDRSWAAAGGRLRTALAPHAPHTTSTPLLTACIERTARDGLPLSIHLAEHRPELELLRDGGGSFVELFRDLGGWQPDWRPRGGSPVEVLRRAGGLGPRTLAVHAVHVDAQGIAALAASGCTVVTCPRSNRFLGCGTAPVPACIAAGVPVALGTDSRASAPDLDPWAEAADLLATHPGIDPAIVLAALTSVPARALGLADRLGTLEPGKADRWIAVPAPGDDPYAILRQPPERVVRPPVEVSS